MTWLPLQPKNLPKEKEKHRQKRERNVPCLPRPPKQKTRKITNSKRSVSGSHAYTVKLSLQPSINSYVEGFRRVKEAGIQVDIPPAATEILQIEICSHKESCRCQELPRGEVGDSANTVHSPTGPFARGAAYHQSLLHLTERAGGTAIKENVNQADFPLPHPR